MTDEEVLALHRDLVATPSESGREAAICGRVLDFLRARGVDAQRFGDNAWAVAGAGPTLCLDTHLDTVPAAPGWTRPPHPATVEDGRVYGLGSGDAKASAAAMIAAFVRLSLRGAGARPRVLLALACQEEEGEGGTRALLPALAALGIRPDAAVVGEPTGLDVAVAQKGLLALELRAEGTACHAANARALGAPNAIRELVRAIAAIQVADLGGEDPDLGPVTVEPTRISGGIASNVVPAAATCVLDVRVNPEPPPDEVLARIRATAGVDVRVIERLDPCRVAPADPLVRAAARVRPGARLYGSRAASDLAFFRGIPAIKAGPGATERSHRPDEWVGEADILEAARFYEALAIAWCGALATVRRE